LGIHLSKRGSIFFSVKKAVEYSLKEQEMLYLKRLPKFEYFEPKTVEEACTIVSQSNGKAKIIAGGTDLLVQMKNREIVPGKIIGLKNIPGLKGIEYDVSRGLMVGPMTTLHEIETSSLVKEKFEILSQATSSMASIQIRNLGTIGGNICSAVPSADTAPPLMVLEARLELVSSKGKREVPIEKFFTGSSETILGHDEILTEILIPTPPSRGWGVYKKHSVRDASDLALVGVAVWIQLDPGSRKCEEIRIALGAVAPTPMRARKAEMLLRGKKVDDALIEQVAQETALECRPISDLRGSAEYRKEMVRVFAKKALEEAIQRIQREEI
jgi:carbon-monoxide dehydrogenase medium subunit